MFAQALEKILSDHATGAVVRGIEAGQADQGLWNTIAQAGFGIAAVAYALRRRSRSLGPRSEG